MKRKDKTEKNKGCFIDACKEPLKCYDRKNKTGACAKHENKWIAREEARERKEHKEALTRSQEESEEDE